MTGLFDDKNAASSKFWRTKSLLPTGKNKPYQQPGLWFPWLSAVLKEDCCTENRNLPNEASLPCSPLDGVNVQLEALLVGLVVFVFFFVRLFFCFLFLVRGWALCPALPSLKHYLLIIPISLVLAILAYCHHIITEVGTVYGHLDWYIQSLPGKGEKQSIVYWKRVKPNIKKLFLALSLFQDVTSHPR